MSLGDAALKLLKEQLLPEIDEIKQVLTGFAKVQDALITRLEKMEKESTLRFDLIDKRFEQIDKRFEQIDKRFDLIDKRFEQIDKRFEQIDKRFEQTDKRLDSIERRMEDQAAEHARRMELLDKRMERLEVRIDRTEERMTEVRDAVARLSLLGEYVRRVDEMATEIRDLRRRQEEFERRLAEDALPRLPKTGT